MGIFCLFALGLALGLLSNRLRPGTPPRPLFDVEVAIIASLFGGLFLAPRLGLPSPAVFPLDGGPIVLASLVALVALLVLYGVRRCAAPSA